MARRTFFSFHYERDAWRAAQVRNCDMLTPIDDRGVIDAVEWEKIERGGPAAVTEWINSQLEGTTVTAVLIGAETAEREWVRYEILKSWNRGNGLVGLRIHNVKDVNSKTDSRGGNPFDFFELPDGTLLSSVCKVYDWVNDDGRNNLEGWSEEGVEIRKQIGYAKEIVEVKTNVRRPGALEGAFQSQSKGFTPRAPWCSLAHTK